MAILYAGINGYLDDVPVAKVTAFTKGLREYLKTAKPQYTDSVKAKKVLGDDEEKALKEAITEFKKTFLATA